MTIEEEQDRINVHCFGYGSLIEKVLKLTDRIAHKQVELAIFQREIENDIIDYRKQITELICQYDIDVRGKDSNEENDHDN
jgi:hypothetical protein